MGQSFKDSGRYAALHSSPNGPGDSRPTSLQILKDSDVIERLKDKVVFVTGGSNGLGVDEVKQLAKTGSKVFFTSRDMTKGVKVKDEILQELKSDNIMEEEPEVEVIKMDLQSLESVRAGAEEFKSKSSKLNILINNAGIAMTPYHITGDGHEQQFQVNHLAHFYLFQLLKQMLLGSGSPSFQSRVISVASSAHTMGSVRIEDYNFDKAEGGYNAVAAYGQAKTCNIWMANELERRYGDKGLHSISVHPGGILTGLSNSHDDASRKMIEQALEIPHIKAAMKSVEQGSASIVLAAIGKEYEGVGGFYMEDCGVSPPMPEDAALGMPGYRPWAYDEQGERTLWSDSLRMLNLKEE